MSTELEAASAEPIAPAKRTTVAAGSVARSLAEAVWALFSLVTGVIVARHLGAAGKGMVSSIGYLAALVGPAVTFGLGEAGVTLTRSHGRSLREAAQASVVWIALASVFGAALLVAFIFLQFSNDLDHLEGATLSAIVAVPALATWYTLALLIEAEGGLLATSAIKVVIALVTLVATAVFVLKMELAVAGAIAAIAGGFVVGALLCIGWLWRKRGVVARPRWSAGFLREALRLGLPIQGSFVLVGLAARADLLIVQVIKGATITGYYSVALTMGQVVAYGPVALSAASFPVAAGFRLTEVVPFIERAGRTAVAAGVVSAVVFLPALPVLLPLLFGPGFSQAVDIAFVLVPGGILHGLQWITCRLWAAQGRGGLLAVSSAASLVSMIVLALALVPSEGAMGAAIASLTSSVIGTAIALAGHRRFADGHASLVRFLPGPADFGRIARLPVQLWRRLAASV